MYDVMCMYGVDDKITFERVNRHGINVQQHPIVFPDSLLDYKVDVPDNTTLFGDFGRFYDRIENVLSHRLNTNGMLHSVTAVINGKAYRSYIWEKDGVFQKNMDLESLYNIYIQQPGYFTTALKNTSFETWLTQKDYFHMKNHSVIDWNARLLELHQKVQSPIFFVYQGRIFKDLPLHYYGFEFLAENIENLFQDIMYCQANIVHNYNNPPLDVDDKTKIAQAGFDVVTSFRGK